MHMEAYVHNFGNQWARIRWIRMGKHPWTKMSHVDSKNWLEIPTKKKKHIPRLLSYTILNNINTYSNSLLLGGLRLSCRLGGLRLSLRPPLSSRNGRVWPIVPSFPEWFGSSPRPAHTCSNKFNLPSSYILDGLEYGVPPSINHNQWYIQYIVFMFIVIFGATLSSSPSCSSSSLPPTVINLRPVKAEQISPWHILCSGSGLPELVPSRAPLGNLGH